MNPITVARAAGALCLVALAACSGLFEPSAPVVGIAYRVERPLDVPTQLHVAIAGRKVTLDAPPHVPGSEQVSVRGWGHGEFLTRVSILTASGDTLAATQVTQKLMRNHHHWVHAVVAESRPEGFCLGTITPVPLRSGTDTMFVVSGDLPKNVIC